jgi:hypothetical protein
VNQSRPPAGTPRLQQRIALCHQNVGGESLQHLQAMNTFHHNVNHIFNSQGKKETIDTHLSGKDGTTWTKSLSNEFGRLAQGNNHGIVGTDTIDFIM